MLEDLRQLLLSPRRVDAEYHILAAKVWKDNGTDAHLHGPLVYAAFEYRCAIERVALELYAIMRDEINGVDDISTIQTFSGLLSRIREIGGGNEKLLRRALQFSQIVCEFVPLPKPLAIPSPSRLHDLWSRLSVYCHRQLIPDKSWESSDWVERGYSLLNEVESYLADLLDNHSFGAMPNDGLPPEVLAAKQAFMAELIDEATLRIRLKLMEPVLARRRNAGLVT